MKITVFLIITLSVFNGFINYSHSQVEADKFNTIFNEYDFKNSPGFAVLVAKGNEVIYQKAFGYANIELGVELMPDHIFRIASITKQFTACAILKLEEEGKLSLEDDITKFIKDFPTRGNKITIEHLLTHTSGIKNYTSSKEWNAEMSKKDYTTQEMIEFIKNPPTDFAPGEKYKYNNSAYFILGYIIETVSGKTYEKYLNDNFFIPLEMENTCYDNTSRIVKNRVTGYHKNEDRFENADYVSMTQPYAAGGLLSNVDDLFKWYTAIMSNQVISKQNRTRAHSSYKLTNGKPTGYGFGWHLGNIQGCQMIHHGGGISGFSTFSLYLPSQKVFVTVLANCDGLSSRKKAYKLAAAAINKPFNREEMYVNSDILSEYEGVYETNENEMRTIIVENGELIFVHPSGSRIRLIPFERDSFFVKNNFTIYSFERNSKSEIISLTANGTSYLPKIYSKTDKVIDVKREVKMPENIKEQYIGQYELMPDFIITISCKNHKMFAKTSKQPDFEITPYAKNKFFSKEFPIEFIFHSNKKGKITKLKIIQNGEYEAKRIR